MRVVQAIAAKDGKMVRDGHLDRGAGHDHGPGDGLAAGLETGKQAGGNRVRLKLIIAGVAEGIFVGRIMRRVLGTQLAVDRVGPLEIFVRRSSG